MGLPRSSIFFLALIAVTTASPFPLLQGEDDPNETCSKGQSFWCQNLRTAKKCSAIKHCIRSVWEPMVPIETDKSEVCKICLDMVKQARDQLLSNETQTDIKNVLEGSCRLCPVKRVQKECIKVMDEFAPELVDALASQMNPQVVCSVAGLCLNSRLDKFTHKLPSKSSNNKEATELTCPACYSLINYGRNKFSELSNAEFLEGLTEICGHTGSYSDSCSALAMKHLEYIRSTFESSFYPKPVCSLAGVCKELYHNHKAPSYDTEANIFATSTSDLPCELCTQLVSHLKDIMIANTTEEEFKLVLEGLCKQMTTYKDECLDVVSKYYPAVYDFLMTELDGPFLCKQINICPKSKTKTILRPLLPSNTEIDAEKAQLPIDRLIGPLTLVPQSMLGNQYYNKDMCSMCEYFLHFLQLQMTLPASEREIKDFVEQGCKKLPASVTEQCNAFIETYMDAFIALLANRIDPSQVCPSLKICPGDLVAVTHEDHPTCPLCLLAMDEILRKPHDTAPALRETLDDLCLRDVFPNSLSVECVRFVNSHRRAITEMVSAEFTASEACTFLELCVPPEMSHRKHQPPPSVVGIIETNEIVAIEKHEQPREQESSDSQICVLCEFVMTKIDQELKDPTTEADIKKTVYGICKHMPRTISKDCTSFVDKYADLVIDLIANEMKPKEICIMISLCGKGPAKAVMIREMEKCLVCDILMNTLKTILTDEEIDDNLNEKLEKACNLIPNGKNRGVCKSIIMQLAPQIEMAMRTLPVGPLVCKRIGLCPRSEETPMVRLVGSKECTYGPEFWCRSTANAASCGAIEYCQRRAWKGEKPKREMKRGHIYLRV